MTAEEFLKGRYGNEQLVMENIPFLSEMLEAYHQHKLSEMPTWTQIKTKLLRNRFIPREQKIDFLRGARLTYDLLTNKTDK